MTTIVTECHPGPNRTLTVPISEVLEYSARPESRRFALCRIQTATGFVDAWRSTREVTLPGMELA